MPISDPQDINRFFSQIRSLVSQRQYNEAKQALSNAHNINPEHSGIALWLGIVEQLSGNLPAALHWLQKADSLKAGDANILFQLGQLQKQMAQNDAALLSFRRAIAAQHELPVARLLIANMLKHSKDFSGAIDILREELTIRPDNTDASVSLAQIFERMNRLDEAAASASATLQIQPGHTGAKLVLAHVARRQENYRQAEKLYRSIIAEPVSTDSQQARAHLAHVLDRQGRYEEAFEQTRICMSNWKQLAAKRKLNPETYHALLQDCSDWLDSQPDSPSHQILSGNEKRPEPIFFVGFPRSGTTLLDQVLRQHPQIISSGETPILETLLQKIPLRANHSDRFPASLDRLSEEDIVMLRDTYFEKAASELPELGEGKTLLDKLPLNIALLPLVARLFPDSPVLVALRDPRDVCLSCFMQTFTLNTAMVCFLDIETTTSTYEKVMGLWLRYREQLDLRWHEYRYEDLVDDFEGVTRQIFDFLQLDYPENAAQFHHAASGDTLMTPSYQDVSKPVYTRARERWRNYREQLAPVNETLAPFIAAFGYPGTES